MCNVFMFLQEISHMELMTGELPEAEKLSKMMALLQIHLSRVVVIL